MRTGSASLGRGHFLVSGALLCEPFGSLLLRTRDSPLGWPMREREEKLHLFGSNSRQKLIDRPIDHRAALLFDAAHAPTWVVAPICSQSRPSRPCPGRAVFGPICIANPVARSLAWAANELEAKDKGGLQQMASVCCLFSHKLGQARSASKSNPDACAKSVRKRACHRRRRASD